MTPTKAAYDVLKAWFYDKLEEERFPVDCHEIAEGFGIKVHADDLDLEFEGALFIESDVSAIILNEKIREEGRRNFTLGHELGHFFLHKNIKELRCTLADLTDFGTNQAHPINIEQEANRFAASLLMPSDDFRRSCRGQDLSVLHLSRLAERYQTSLTATAYRMVELVNIPLALIIVRGGRVYRWRRNEQMKQTGFWLAKECEVLETEHLMENVQVDADVWLNEERAPFWSLKQSSIYMPYYETSLILISAESTEFEQDYWDGVPDSVDQFPKW